MENIEVNLKRYRPNIFIKIGASLNIIFASLFSVLGVTSFITIPAIVFNSFLFSTRISEKRYWGTIRILPMVLSFIIGILMIVIIFFASDLIIRMYNTIINMANDLIFWKSNDSFKTKDPYDQIFLWLKILFVVVSLLGNFFILIGWYKGKSILISESKSTNKKDIKKEKKLEKENKKELKKSINKKDDSREGLKEIENKKRKEKKTIEISKDENKKTEKESDPKKKIIKSPDNKNKKKIETKKSK